MDADSVSIGNVSDQRDSCSGYSGFKPKVAPKDDFLSALNEEFEKSKADLLGRFLGDQAELNRRFGESQEADDTTKDASEDNSEHSLKETETLLRQRLALHRPGFGTERARTSMGFYNHAEFKTADRHSNCSSRDSTASPQCDLDCHLNPEKCDDSEQPSKHTTEMTNSMASSQACLRPKTCIGKRSIIKPQILTQKNGYSYETVTIQRDAPESPNGNKTVSLAFEEFRPCYLVKEYKTQRNGTQVTVGRSMAISSRTTLRPVKRTPAITRQHGEREVIMANRIGTNIRFPLSDAKVSPDVSAAQSALYRRRRDVLLGESSVSCSPSSSCDLSPCNRRLGKSSRSQKQARELNLQNNFPNRKNGCNISSFQRTRPLALVKLPPLDAAVARSPSASKTLNPVCY